jgi:hypothetical protein
VENECVQFTMSWWRILDNSLRFDRPVPPRNGNRNAVVPLVSNSYRAGAFVPRASLAKAARSPRTSLSCFRLGGADAPGKLTSMRRAATSLMGQKETHAV